MSDAKAAHQPTRQQLDELDALLQKMLALPLSPFEESLPPVPPPPPLPTALAPARPPVAEADLFAEWSGLIRTAPATMARPGPLPAPAPPPPPVPAPAPDSSVFAAWGVAGLSPEARQAVPRVHSDPATPELGRPVGPLATVPAGDSGNLGNHLPARVPLRPTEPPVHEAGTFRYAGLEAHAIEDARPVPPPDEYRVADSAIVYPPTASAAVAPPAAEAAEDDVSDNEEMQTQPRVPLLLMPFDLADRAAFGIAAWFGPPGRWLGSSAGRHLVGVTGILCLAGAVAWGVADWLGWTW